MKKYEQKAEKCVVSINFKPNKTFWIATNNNYREVTNTNFTKYVKIDLIQIKFSQIFPNANNTNPNLTKYIKEPPNTGILKVFSVFANTKCHALVLCLTSPFSHLTSEYTPPVHWSCPSADGGTQQ